MIMSQDTVTTKRKHSKVKIAVLSLAALSFVGGAASNTFVGQASANSEGNDSHHSQMHKGNYSTNAALIVDAVEAYQATPKVDGTAPVTSDISRVTKLAIDKDNAVGMIDSGDSGSHFFAHKIDGVWEIVFAGQTTPPKDIVDKYGIPSKWLDPSFNF
jgi:hypothetical protein